MNKAVIFDLDGTLIDSLPDITYNLNLAFAKFGFPTRSSADFRKFIGNGARRLVKDSIGAGVSESVVDECLKYYNTLYTASGSPNTGLFDGVAEMLIKLKEKGYKLAINTNKPQETTDDVCQTYLKRFGFDLVVGQSEKFKCKPDKQGTEYILNALNVLPENACFIGDGETDVLTAKSAGIRAIAVLWGYRDKFQLESAGAKVFAESPSDIIRLLED